MLDISYNNILNRVELQLAAVNTPSIFCCRHALASTSARQGWKNQHDSQKWMYIIKPLAHLIVEFADVYRLALTTFSCARATSDLRCASLRCKSVHGGGIWWQVVFEMVSAGWPTSRNARSCTDHVESKVILSKVIDEWLEMMIERFRYVLPTHGNTQLNASPDEHRCLPISPSWSKRNPLRNHLLSVVFNETIITNKVDGRGRRSHNRVKSAEQMTSNNDDTMR